MRSLNDYFLNAYIADVSTAGQIYVVAPDDGYIVEAYSALNGAITIGNATLTLKIGGTAVTGGTITIATAGSAAGDVDSCTPTAANYVTKGSTIEIETDGGSDTAAAVMLTLVIRR